MPNKTLTAKVKLDTSQAKRSLDDLVKKINNISNVTNKTKNTNIDAQLNKSADAATRLGGALSNGDKAAQRLNKAAYKRWWQETATTHAINGQVNALASGDKASQRLSANAEKRNRSAYEQWWKEQLITQEQYEQERIRQQSLNTLTKSDMAAQKMANTQRQAMYDAMFIKLEWQKAHPILSKLSNGWQKINSNIQKAVSGSPRLSSAYNKITSTISGIKNKVSEWLNKQNQVKTSIKSTGSGLTPILGKLKQIAQTYLGIMGVKAITKTSDILTNAENKLNYISANSLGQQGYNEDGTYSTQTLNATQDALDKMYASSQKVRMSYNDMMSNVSKTMSLAGNAFDNNIDNAIRFQEIMSEAYAVGGATTEEMSSSMYQLTQALGAGTLAGDELRSVREGAPLAYKAIEEFAQSVYNTEESLKDLASQGKITSDMVVAAIMKSGDKLDNAFAQTKQTFGQTMDQIKNAALYAFQPVMRMFSDLLNKAIDNGLVEKFEVLFTNLAKVVMIVVTIISNAIQWVAENWDWLKYVILGALTIIGIGFLQTAIIAVISAIKTAMAWLVANWQLLLIVAAIMLVLYWFDQFKKGAISLTELLINCATLIGVAIVIIGILINSTVLIVIGLIILVAVLIFMNLEDICYWVSRAAGWVANAVLGVVNFIIMCVYLLLTLIWNIIALVVNLITGAGNATVAIAHNAVAGIINLANGLWNVIKALGQNILIAFQNAWNGALSSFWNFVADCVEGLKWLAKPIAAIAKLFGKSFDVEDFSASLRAKADSHQQQAYVSIGDAWSSGLNTVEYKSVGDAWSKGWNTMDFASFSDAAKAGINTFDYVDPSAWGEAGRAWGSGIKSSINEWGSQFQNTGEDGKSSFLDGIGEKLGLDLGGMTGDFPSVDDPANSVANSYNQPDPKDLMNGVGNIDKNTGKMADSMDLAEEDLSLLKDMAERDWINKFTAATINIDMKNSNTINDKGDLGNWAVDLRDMIEEELFAFANGVYDV